MIIYSARRSQCMQKDNDTSTKRQKLGYILTDLYVSDYYMRSLVSKLSCNHVMIRWIWTYLFSLSSLSAWITYLWVYYLIAQNFTFPPSHRAANPAPLCVARASKYQDWRETTCFLIYMHGIHAKQYLFLKLLISLISITSIKYVTIGFVH